jgi:serine/threonine protein kinase
LAQDPERLARFEREAKVLASLNHPNIAQIYRIEESNGVRALVMELIPGQSIPARLPVETAINSAGKSPKRSSRARQRHRPSRPEARQHSRYGVRCRQRARFWLGSGG